MPQTSPMNWMIVAIMMTATINVFMSSNLFKKSLVKKYNEMKKTKVKWVW